MNRRKIFRRAVSMLFVVSIMLVAAVTHAEIYTGEGSYVMSKDETLEVARERAKADAMRNASEQAFVYVKSYSRSKNFNLEEDIIETMTANILKLVEKPIFQMLEEVDNLEGVMIRVSVKVEIDDSDINRWLNKPEHEISELVAQMEALHKANEEQERQIAEIKRQLANNPQDNERLAEELAAENKIFLANLKVNEGWKLWSKKDFYGAVKLFGEAIELNPNYAEAWRGRGVALTELKQYEQAVKYHDKAVEVKPDYVSAYYSRAWNYLCMKQYQQAIQDYDKTIELNPNSYKAYNNRGCAYMNGLKQNEQAIRDFTKAIELNPNFAWAYNNRGFAHMKLKQYDKAIPNLNKAIELNPENALAYYGRAYAYDDLENYQQAIEDCTKAVQFDSPRLVDAYNNRGEA